MAKLREFWANVVVYVILMTIWVCQEATDWIYRKTHGKA